MSAGMAVFLYIAVVALLLVLRIVSLRRQRERDERRMSAWADQERRYAQDRDRQEEHHRAFVAEQRRLMSDSLRYDVMRRDGFRCQICGITAKEGAKLHVDHIRPVSKGGRTEISNLRTLCDRCNLGKGAKPE